MKTEADIERNWSRSLEWRGDCRYAVMIAKVIAGYYKSVRLQRKLKIEVLSNDNAFLNYHPFYFTQRTLFARFQINTTSPPHSQFIKKPHLEAEEATEPDSLLTTIATRNKQGKNSFVSVVVAYGNGSDIGTKHFRAVNVVLRNLWRCEWRFVLHGLDNINTNPYMVWKSFDRPVFPSEYERTKMREVEEPRRLTDPTNVNGSTWVIPLKLTISSIHLIQLCCKPDEVPSRVFSVSILNITSNEVLVTWKYRHQHSRCLRTYEVELRSECSTYEMFERVNPKDTIFLSFHYVGKDLFKTYLIPEVKWWAWYVVTSLGEELKENPLHPVLPYPSSLKAQITFVKSHGFANFLKAAYLELYPTTYIRVSEIQTQGFIYFWDY
ncbi:hypothetical protein NQ317_014763 [Molorchus minor]|uniref:Uncharacterized protein n=1 Tax=Molorchus minor TaxID=1323400 RepID=A0ABQ9J1E9_9CUCU|nr:hypothetical protein NQ317_014763 [Molorchus minor]